MPNFAKTLTTSIECVLFGHTAMRLAKRMKGCVLMFSDIKRILGEKSKRAVALLAMMILLCGFTGCDSKERSNTASDSAVSGWLSTPVTESNDLQSSEVNSGNTGSSDVQNAQSVTCFIKPEIVMDGQLITLPCKVEDIVGITIDREYSFVVVPASENVDEYSTAYFYYNGKRAGLIRLDGDCSEKADLGKETVVGIDFYDNMPVSCFGLTFQSKREDIIDMLGNPDNGGNTVMSFYIDGNPANHIDFDLNSNGKMRAVRIYLGLAD